MTGEMLKGHLDLLILSAVSRGRAHGYELIDRLREQSKGVFDLAEGTVYPALHRLEEDGLLKSDWVTPPDTGRKRRVYEITPRGRATLKARATDWKRFAESINAVLGGMPWPTPT